jgi:hypothetical protein
MPQIYAKISGFLNLVEHRPEGSSGLVPRIILRLDVFKPKRTNRRDLGNIFTGFCPMEVRRVARQHNHSARRVSLQLIGIEFIAQSDIGFGEV